MTSTPTDPEVARLAALPVSAVADVLDRLGRRSQAHGARRPAAARRAASRSRAARSRSPRPRATSLLDNPYEHELAAVDATPAGAVVVLATGGLLDVAVWGELLTTRMLARGGVGVVTDGGVRDVAGIRRPRRARRSRPRSRRATRSAARSSPAGASPSPAPASRSPPGDLVRGDEDGVVVVPRELAAEALAAAEEKLGLERLVPRALARGESAADLYDRYGVL